jgi:fatty acid desaturase
MSNANSFEATAYDPARAAGRGDYAELKRLVKEKGLLRRQPRYYALQILSILSLLAASITILALVENLWLQLLNAVFLAFVFQQIVFIGHDSAHREIFSSVRNNNLVALVAWNLLLGISKSWWMGRHNSHHAHTNELDVDPDAELGFLCFSEAGAVRRTGFQRLLLQYQAFLMPVLSLYPIMLRYYTFKFLLLPKGSKVGKIAIQRRLPLAEIVSVAVHYVWFLGLPFYFLGLWDGLLFVLIQQALFGIYYASVTASNHKGMPTLLNRDIDFLR